jgi:hypothetical protein
MALEIRPDNREEDDFYRDHTRYLIGIGLISQEEGEHAKSHFFSGFLMEFANEWFWVTAGHILKLIDELQNTERFFLLDHYGTGTNEEAIPFDYANAWRYYVDDDDAGLDFGAVRLSREIQTRLAQNEAVAVTEIEWRSADYTRHESYFMVGLAFESIFRTTIHGKDGYVLRGKPKPDIIWTDARDPIPYKPDAIHPRLIASISKNWAEGDIQGMSGGPLFGVRYDLNTMPVVAVQSAWYIDERVVVACPVQVFAPMLEERILEALSSFDTE